MIVQKYNFYKNRVEKLEAHLNGTAVTKSNKNDGDARHKLAIYRSLMIKLKRRIAYLKKSN